MIQGFKQAEALELWKANPQSSFQIDEVIIHVDLELRGSE